MPSELKYRRWQASGLFIVVIVALMLGLAPEAIAQTQSGALLRIIQSDSNHVVLELQVSGYNTGAQTADGTAFSVITVPDLGSTGEPGKPALPIKGAMIGIPPGAQAALQVLDDQSQQDALARPPLPVPTQRVRFDLLRPESPSSTTSYARDAATYAANRLYPADATQIASTGNWRSQRYAIVEFHPLQYNPASRTLVFHRRLRVQVTFTYPGGLKAGALGGPSNEGPFEAVLQKSLLNYDSAKNWRSTSQPALRAPSRGTAYTGGTWYRVGVKSDGIYRVTCSALPGSPGSIDPATLRLFKEGTEMAINVVGNWSSSCTQGDYIEFWGQSPDSFYSQAPYNQPVRAKYARENIYWLNFGVKNGRRMAVHPGGLQGSLQSTFTDTVHLERNLRYYSITPSIEDKDHWVWDYVSASYGDRTYPFPLSRVASGTYSATLQIDLYGWTLGAHQTAISITGALGITNTVDNSIWPASGTVERQATFAFDQSWLTNGNNTITVSEANNPPDTILTNYFDVSYQANFIALANTLRFRQPSVGPAQYSITNFSDPNLNVFDITDRFNVAQFNGLTVTGGGPYTLAFGDNPGGPTEYIALASTAVKSPSSITLDTASNLQSPGNTADYILITFGGFRSNVQPLAAWRSAPNLRVQVVDVQDIYDEFSDGLVDAHAIRAFLEYAYANWNGPRPNNPPPSYVLLVGDGTYDPRGYCDSGSCDSMTPPLNSTFIPPYLRTVDPFIGEAASDNRFVSFNDGGGSGNTLPNMMIGRLPANSTAEVDTMVNRTIAYEQNPPAGTWGSRMTFVADTYYDKYGNTDDSGNFWTFSDGVAGNGAYVPGIFGTTRVYFSLCPSCTNTTPTTPAIVKSSILSAIDSGSLFLSYIGHGNTEYWSNSDIFHTTDTSALTNTGKLTILLEMTCLTGQFTDPRPAGNQYPKNSMAETLLRATLAPTSGSQAVGAVADWAPTGWGQPPGHDLLEKGFLNGIMYKGARQIGAATIIGESNLWTNGNGSYRDLVDTFVLLGDPALHLTIPSWSNYYMPMIQK